ncbi:alpha/beta-hydrolase [Rhizodiscina lignyota]|uniref:Alpha/beta-hydrolase n=1 Tax=Rhizodiscina lignyota TaxID=1504668 RepID=A0A9P4IAU0_9PEZI|nr:alpha/beta-hydrolase [Rhizodiscina lignyota]
MPNTKTVQVPLLGGVTAAYQTPSSQPSIDPSKPTLILVNSFTTSSELYQSQYNNKALTDAMNLVSIELLGHGQTRTKRENFTYWDTAEMNLQVMEALGIKKAFVLGTSQGGWITVRMALLGPDVIEGIIPLGTSLDSESERTRMHGCWNGPKLLSEGILKEATSTKATPDFEPSTGYCDFLIDIGFGKNCPSDVRDFWRKTIKSNYQGDDGRRRIRMAGINLAERDGLHGRLSDVVCPVLWLHGTDDAVYSVSNAQEEVKLFTRSPDAQVVVVDKGQHFLSFSHPKEVDNGVIEFVKKYHK